MKIKFKFLGLDCEAEVEMVNGDFEPKGIKASGTLEILTLSIDNLDDLQLSINSAARSELSKKPAYTDNTNYFGEEV
jgi:hypothetical protein